VYKQQKLNDKRTTRPTA